ncbi:MAG: DNA mismatch repair endonuclease MutL [Clostridia bacterium]|nr:DNA mismatch repair endonuclease MutL [Clostridia bacterium]
MAKINQLGFEVANLIAAGEVVERPASVVKELLENAIDAGAHAVTVEIARGGVSLIRVADDGEGMTREDLPLAIRRHATSKIKTASDLDAIGTLGFRGEALAATAAVSTLTIISKTRESEEGAMLVCRAGEVEEVSEVGCADGTTVTVEDLFINVPARRKFLKKDVTETAAVTAVVEKIAISHPEVAIRYITDGTVRFSTAGDGKLLNTLYALYGREFASRLLPVEGSVGGVGVSGHIGRPDNARANRNQQSFFINGRYVKSKTVGAAVERAFTSYMAPERFPVAVIFLDIPTFAVDVNVHPAKLEVKFENEKAVFEAVYYAVREALEGCESRPSMSFDRTKGGKQDLTHRFETESAKQIEMPPILRPAKPTAPDEPPVIAPQKAPAPVRVTPATAPVPAAPVLHVAAKDTPTAKAPTLSPEESLAICEKYADAMKGPSAPTAKAEEKLIPVAPSQAEATAPAATVSNTDAPSETLPPYRILGTAFRTYVFVELSEDRMLVIDQHAAHERILFEQLKKKQETAPIASEPLLLPVSFAATPEEIAVAQTETASFERLGFTYSLSGDKVHLLSIPADVTPPDARDLFLSLCAESAKGEDPAIAEKMRREKMLYQMACKAAIKGGRIYDDAHTVWLVERVLALPDVTVCPHGRPIAYYLTKKELDRQFDRLK